MYFTQYYLVHKNTDGTIIMWKWYVWKWIRIICLNTNDLRAYWKYGILRPTTSAAYGLYVFGIIDTDDIRVYTAAAVLHSSSLVL